MRDLESGARTTKGGIFILDDNAKDTGIRSRWGQVYAVGPDVTDIKAGEWILIDHGRWTFGMEIEDAAEGTIKIWAVDYPNSVTLVSAEFPSDIKPIK